MPSVQVTPTVLTQLAYHIRVGEIKTLKVQKRVSGKNKGLLFADFTVKQADPEPTTRQAYYRQRVAYTMLDVAKSISNGDTVEFRLAHTPEPEGEKYSYYFEVK